MPKFRFFSALLVILGLKEDKKLLVVSSCTDELQSFHRPLKKQKSAPIKAEHLGKGESEQCDPDPRPDHFKNKPSYQDEVNMRTLIIALTTEIQCGGTSSAKQTFKQLQMTTDMRSPLPLDLGNNTFLTPINILK